MIKAREISTLLGEGYEDNARWVQATWGDKEHDWQPVESGDEDLQYYVREEGSNVRIDNVGTFFSIDNGGVFHDGGEIYFVVKFVDLEGNSENFVLFGHYSSWDSNYFDSDWVPAESYEFTETRWRARK